LHDQTETKQVEIMKKLNPKKIIIVGLTLAGLSFTPGLHADVEVLVSGGNASSSVLFDRATNLFGGSFSATYGLSSGSIRTYVGTITGHTGLGTVTLDFNLSGAVGGLNDISTGNPEARAQGGTFVPTVVDSSASPDVVGVDPSQFTALATYVVPYVFIKNSNSADTAGVTNLTQRQAALLESAGATLPATFFGGGSTNVIYFVGRNKDSAVRTEVDLNIQANGFQTYTTNGLGQIYQDTTNVDLEGNVDPGQVTGSGLLAVVRGITNSIGTVAVQNTGSGVTILSYEGVPYSTNNVQSGSYPLWGDEKYYYLTSLNNANQLEVINALYQSVTNAAFQTTSPVFVNKFVSYSNLKVTRNGDGGPIIPKPGY
jgi:hypothetical protein